ncbi:MAG TPA: mechanosensitive ion channel family protein [Gammaproteobacteria bacterium]|nr:mechanosensitive ion channel family protein [Gammaproteobacteria bacterium]
MQTDWLSKLLVLAHQADALTWIVITVNLILAAFSRQLVKLSFHQTPNSHALTRRTTAFRALNLLIVIVFIYTHFYTQNGTSSFGLTLLAIIIVIYLAYLSSTLVAYFLLRRYGKRRQIGDKIRFSESYNSQLLTLFAWVFIGIVTLITIIRLLGFNSLLEAGGVIGFIGVFLALTQASWAPDIFSGLIILNSDMLNEGDVIELRGIGHQTLYGLVYKTKVFHTEILNLVNNHRIMIRNSTIRDQVVHNLSKFASSRGLREVLRFKIGYEVPPEKVRKFLLSAWDSVVEKNIDGIEAQYKIEIGVGEVGDHAVEWCVYYHTKAPDQLRRLRMELNELFLHTAYEMDLSLATPLTHQVNGIDSPAPVVNRQDKRDE